MSQKYSHGVRDRNSGKIVSRHADQAAAKKKCDRLNQKAREAIAGCPAWAIDYSVVTLNTGIKFE